jgi:hypothetical protein
MAESSLEEVLLGAVLEETVVHGFGTGPLKDLDRCTRNTTHAQGTVSDDDQVRCEGKQASDEGQPLLWSPDSAAKVATLRRHPRAALVGRKKKV